MKKEEKSVMISVNPKHCKLVLNRNATILIRKTRPKIETPFKCYIYCTLSGIKEFSIEEYMKDKWSYKKGKVIAEFICDEIEEYEFNWCDHEEIGLVGHGGDCWFELEEDTDIKSCMTCDEINLYGMEYGREQNLFGWQISDLKIYEKPRELSEFNMKRPPQSCGCVESEKKSCNEMRQPS